MKENALAVTAIQAVPEILKSLGGACEKFAEPICNAIQVYGCRNQLAIVESVKCSVPEFVKFSEQFLEKYTEFITIAEQSSSRNYELVVSAVMDSEMSIEEKVTYVMEIENDRAVQSSKRWEPWVKTIALIGVTTIFSIALCKGFPEIGKTIRTVVEERGKTKRSFRANYFKYKKR